MNKHIIQVLALTLATPLMTSCLEEYTPTSGATQEQVNEGDKNYLVNAIPSYLNTYSSDEASDIGFLQNFIWRDASTCDVSVQDSGWDYYQYIQTCVTLGSQWGIQYTVWSRYYALIQKANLVFEAIDIDKNPEDAIPAGTACAYRANAYLEMGQWYEFKKTGIGALDDKAEADGIMGLTVPIVTEKTTEKESRNNPRAPFYTLYRFILTDLNNGERYLRGTNEPVSKTMAGPGLIYGLQARLWLLMGSRFDYHPEDLATALSHEDDTNIPYDKLGVTTARECFEKAADYARKAINCGYTPLTETQWFDPTTGFNTVNNAWIWANIISKDNGLASSMVYQSWVSYMSPEATYGIAYYNYGAYRLIDARLFRTMTDSDWRKTTWIAPEDAHNQEAYNTKYAKGTSMGFDSWNHYEAYAAFKFHPANGDVSISTSGNAVSTPLMRVEEMYLIEAEATGRAYGEGAGRALLEAFVNGYRYTDGSYKSTGVGIEGFIDDVFTQKRIELWGEGQILWDYKRLERPIIKGYPGTNFPPTYRFNSLPNHAAPWATFSIPDAEHNFNEAVILNPDPSHGSIYQVWEEE